MTEKDQRVVFALAIVVIASGIICIGVSTSDTKTTAAAEGPAPEVIVSIDLVSLRARGARGQKTCTCGYVQGFGSGPDHSGDGTRILPTRHLSLASHPRPIRDDDSAAQYVMAWWKGGAPTAAAYPRKQLVCALGRYDGAALQDADVVSACP